MYEVFYQPGYFSKTCMAFIDAYWGFYNESGILQCFETREDAEAAIAERRRLIGSACRPEV